MVVAGGTGFVGKALVTRLAEGEHSVVVLTRHPDKPRLPGKRTVQLVWWDGKTVGPWASHVDGADAVLNFAGESIGERWTARRKSLILDSRVNATRAIVEAIRSARKKPQVLINASAVGYYGAVDDEEVSESRTKGEGFLADVCDKWEQEARAAESLDVRVVMTRSGVVLGKGGGALERMLLPFKLFAGGPIGSGRQWFPWIHRDDLIAIVMHALTDRRLSGPVNVVAPECVTMRQFCTALGKAMHRPSWAPAPAFAFRILLGEMSSMILTGQRVVPEKLLKSGYEFRFPSLAQALEDVL
jgi:hypothetical protein